MTKVEERNYKEVYVSPYNNQEYKRYECPNCDLHWWEPLKIIPEFYESEFIDAYIGFHTVQREKLGVNHEPFFKYFPKNVRGRLLDIGCGDGVFLRYAKGAGFEVWGIDFDSKSVEVARKGVGVDTIYVMSLEEFYDFAKKKGLKFDVITFFEVLEHQDKPREFLDLVKYLLKDGGYIAGSVPNRESYFWQELNQKYSHGDFPPNHFLRFSDVALRKCLEIAEFDDVRIYKLDFTFEELYPSFVEKKIFGNIDSLKVKLKAKFLDGNEKLAKAIKVEELKEHSDKRLGIIALMTVKLLRNIVLLPFTIFYLHKLKKNGIHLFFIGKLGNNSSY
ncbi:class I SAM-dependent methyltransferase [Caldisericum sp.]|uniref:class I SAM-dependent methyltransferase n=1 Tax=Caldisericum sp. TaxID=2499687 RepID=UPI003D0AA9F9